jgi:hypothetical protein
MTAYSKENWMNTKWRPAMGWMYMIVCITDFIIFPILWSMLQAMDKGSVTTQWQPLTLQGAGLFHVAIGAIVGVTAWSRGQEKLGGAINGNTTTDILSSRSPTFGVPSTHSTSTPMARSPVTQPAFVSARQTVVNKSGKPSQEPDPEL